MVWKRWVSLAKAQGDLPEAIKRCNEYLQVFQADPNAVREKEKERAFRLNPSHTRFLSLLTPPPQLFFSQWQELAELYLRTGHPSEAAFCYEELILGSPANFAFHAALAEVYVAVGGVESLRLARKHFAQALELHGGENLRALYGMCTVWFWEGSTLRPVPHTSRHSSSPDLHHTHTPNFTQTCHAIATAGRKEDKVDAPVNAALFAFAADKIKAHYARVNPALLPLVDKALRQQQEETASK